MAHMEEKDPYLDVLKEIKGLMDSRLGDKLGGGMSVEKVSVHPLEGSPEEEKMESPLEESKEDETGEGDMDMSPEEKDELMKLYSKG